GELCATGVAAAVANAVYDAIGVRVRELPITPNKLMGGL
ncbi:CO/xanthine dehydrogenase Mo-binding subunit, partial [Paraburkholderia sp. GAS206C]